jgi:hypothetical protein
MNKDWPTKHKDMHTAQIIMEEFAKDNESDSLGLFELKVNQKEKRMDFHLANWVVAIAKHFKQLYGANKGDSITRQVISQCITQGQTIH